MKATAFPPAEDPDQGFAALMREALIGAGTTVWEWDVASDRLTGIDGTVALLGYRPGEIGWSQLDWDTLIHPADLDSNNQAFDRHAAGLTPSYEFEYRARAADGHWRWLLERGRIVSRQPDGSARRVVGTLYDATVRRQAELQAHTVSERLLRLAAHVPGVLYQYTAPPEGRGRFTYVSENVRPLLGLSPDMLMADDSVLFDLFAPGDAERVWQSLRESQRSLQSWRCEFEVRLKDGQSRWLLGMSTPKQEVDEAGLTTITWHGYLQDVSELRVLERARREGEAAEAANRAKTSFLSRVSHELRTPLNAVLGFAQLMEIDQQEPLRPGQQRRVAHIRQAGEHLVQMIGDLLDLTRIESGHLTVDLQPLRLAPLLHECAEMLRPMAQSQQVLLQLPPAHAPDKALADGTRLRQVLLNLLSNAIKYNRPGGLVLVRLEPRVTPAGVARLALVVQDTGVGIAPEQRKHLFEPFNRLGHQNSRIEGSGIGLAVTHGLVELMGGQIEVQSTAGSGSTFSVLLPTG